MPIEQIGTAVTVVTARGLEDSARSAMPPTRCAACPASRSASSGGIGNLTQVRIRGAEANQTLVLIDGIEANNADRRRVRLLQPDDRRHRADRGHPRAQSGIYGSSAIGGVINIITRGGRGPLTIHARAEGGSFDTRDGSTAASRAATTGCTAISYDRRKTDGFNISPIGNEDDGGEALDLLVPRRLQRR